MMTKFFILIILTAIFTSNFIRGAEDVDRLLRLINGLREAEEERRMESNLRANDLDTRSKVRLLESLLKRNCHNQGGGCVYSYECCQGYKCVYSNVCDNGGKCCVAANTS